MENRSPNKKELRERYQSILDHLTADRKKSASLQANSFLAAWVNDRLPEKGGFIAAFSPFKGEIDLWPIYQLWMDEERLVMPRISGKALTFHLIKKIEDLSPSIFSLLEPETHLPQIALEDISMIFVPGLAFDNEMYRLGRGLGFYDRLLAILPKDIPRIGVGYREQLSEAPLPRAPHDQPITERLLF